MSKGYNRAVAPNIDYSGNCVAPTETEAELVAYRKEKLKLMDEFFVGRKKLTGEKRKQFKQELDAKKSMRSIDDFCRDYISKNL